jgi:hypothetical protein
MRPTISATSLALAFTCAASLTVSAAHAADDYDFFLVTSFNPSYQLAETLVTDINDSNIAVGSDTFGGFYWNESQGKIPLPWNGSKDINNLGWVNFGNFLYHPQTAQSINIPSPSASYPLRNLFDLNDQMDGVGSARHTGSGCEPFNCPYDCGSAFVFSQSLGSRHLNVPNLKALHAINNHNIAVGVIITNCDDNRGIVHDLETDQMINLSDLLPPIPAIGRPAQVWPVDVNDQGQVIGTAITGNEPERPFLWSLENPGNGFIWLPPIPNGQHGYMDVNAVNNRGEVVGEALDFATSDWKAFIWDPVNGTRTLASLVEEPAEFLLENAYSINDNGWIAGSGHFGPAWATQKGFVLKPHVQPNMPGDVNGDSVVNITDLLAVISQWGPCSGACAADVTGDQVVNIDDLLVVLNEWSCVRIKQCWGNAPHESAAIVDDIYEHWRPGMIVWSRTTTDR